MSAQGCNLQVAEGLFSVCVTLGTIPILRCAPGGVAEAVARALSNKIATHLKGRGAALFVDNAPTLAAGAQHSCDLYQVTSWWRPYHSSSG